MAASLRAPLHPCASLVLFPSVKDNEDFVAAVSALAEEAKCPVTICPLPENRNDRWIQVGDVGLGTLGLWLHSTSFSSAPSAG